jgi:hypothetical protein
VAILRSARNVPVFVRVSQCRYVPGSHALLDTLCIVTLLCGCTALVQSELHSETGVVFYVGTVGVLAVIAQFTQSGLNPESRASLRITAVQSCSVMSWQAM